MMEVVSSIRTVPSLDPEARRVLIHWDMDKSVTSPSCLPTKRTPSTSFSRWHLTGSSTVKSFPLPTLVVSILKTQFPIPTNRISCRIQFLSHFVCWRLTCKINIMGLGCEYGVRLYLLVRVPTYPWMVSFSVSYNLDGDFNLSSNLWFIFLIRSFINPPHIYPPFYARTAEDRRKLGRGVYQSAILDNQIIASKQITG